MFAKLNNLMEARDQELLQFWAKRKTSHVLISKLLRLVKHDNSGISLKRKGCTHVWKTNAKSLNSKMYGNHVSKWV